MDSQANHPARKTDRDSHAGRTSFVTTQFGDDHHGTVTGHDSGDAYLTSPSGDSTDSMRVSGLGKGPHAQKGGMFGVGTRQVVTTTKDARGNESTGMVPYNESVHGEWKGK
jgi:hypothetical protein